MALILDAMGSDTHPGPEVAAAVEAAAVLKEEIILVGSEELLAPLLRAANPQNHAVRIVHAPDVLEMGDKAVEGARKKPLNSMAVGMGLIKSGEGSAFVTAGNTGGAMFNGLRTLGRMKGVQRPALTTIFPTRTGHCVVLDIGANAECRPEFLVQFALMGEQYARKVLKLDAPRVGLLSNGEEAGKGNTLVKETFPLLEAAARASGMNFIGNVEGKELFGGAVDVVVTDGFTGNIMLKASEAVAKLLVDTLKTELNASLVTKVGAALAMPAFRKLRGMMEPDEVGGAPLLGLDGLVFVGHGRSNAHALVSALRVAQDLVQADLLGGLRQSIQQSLEAAEKN